MIQKFFSVPQSVLPSGTSAKLKPTAQRLYICLLHESERCCTRVLKRTDEQLSRLSGNSTRAFRDARIKLQECGLIRVARGLGNVYVYVICDPETSQPWPGDPKQRIPYVKK